LDKIELDKDKFSNSQHSMWSLKVTEVTIIGTTKRSQHGYHTRSSRILDLCIHCNRWIKSNVKSNEIKYILQQFNAKHTNLLEFQMQVPCHPTSEHDSRYNGRVAMKSTPGYHIETSCQLLKITLKCSLLSSSVATWQEYWTKYTLVCFLKSNQSRYSTRDICSY